ncbi:undecaprenyldiphospho-muramoylpentapeptide beta-N-acetylglucosaminyltransferase [Rothia sp. AR01]|uniref:UDP-N-acetylglucosamine--N-acetylmuramyl-(pentapeptide) pyrophosphoryl-undecaprenol N-acetylglucosamine transferase n=1 Tax=Rothia santali TaxID=2949643 RepID=A0A9X2HCQ2_9MICC|nr:undecaprenyldiphospho-muramoylpentapeptide beta-N-acetylglucosaminyltransferase [Rothia santali]MCP3427214.1 undecaprenyldiphospho-muramoylpentapeptide beta-N-acetylglucosaminyltransferase [Rothia santali]
MNESLSVVLAGGGTAGHVSPLLAIADAVRAADPQSHVVAVGTTRGLEARLVPDAGYDLEFVERVPLPRRPSVDLLRLPGRFRRAVAQGREILRRHRADVLVGVGGYVCTPMYVAAARENVPIVIHEANRRPGLANRVGARRAAVVATAFEDTPLKGARRVGMPLRRGIALSDRDADRSGARQLLGLQAVAPTIVVTGGSSGAQSLNRAVAEFVQTPEWERADAQLLHVTGAGKEVRDADGDLVTGPGYYQTEYVESMENVYAACDLLVARAGAATVCEVAAVGCPTVFVPLPIGNGEQALNASELVEAGAALTVRDAELTPAWLAENVLPLVHDAERLRAMSEAAAAQGHRDAAQRMAEIVAEAATHGRSTR